MGFGRFASVFVFAAAFVIAALAPVQTGPASLPRAANGPVILVDAWNTDPAMFASQGAELLADYGNGIVLMRLPPTDLAVFDGWPGVDILKDRTFIDLYYSGILFDTAKDVPVFASNLQSPYSGAYLLQFRGPIKNEWIAHLESVGLKFEQYLANFAYVVRGTSEGIAVARALPYVGWIGPYHAGYKLSPKLLARSGEVYASVIGFEAYSPESLALRVGEVGGSVDMFWDSPPTAIVRIPSERLASLAQLPEVLMIQEYVVPVPTDRIAGQIHNYHSAWDTGRSGLPSTLTGHSPGPDATMYTSDDYKEGAGIMDTGFDEADANDGALDFFDSPNGDRVTRYMSHTARASMADGTCGSAHGTHVAGIIAADGYAYERDLAEDSGVAVDYTDKEWHKSEAGVVPEGLVSIDGVQAGTAFNCQTGLLTNLAYWDCQYLNGYITVPLTAGVSAAICGAPWIDGSDVATHNTAVDAGSRAYFAVNSNSWGSGPGSYGGVANAADTRTNAAPERLIIIAAGNDGPDLGTISSTALGKNGLAIAASQNFVPEQFESDNPNMIAGFSSRGGPGVSGGRIKPDLTTIGTSVVSLFGRGETLSTGWSPGADLLTYIDKYDSLAKGYSASGDGVADYRYLQGTSMATPHAAGMALLVREYLREVVAGNNPASPYFNPDAHLVKAFLINGAVRMDPLLYDYPGYDQGWGRVDIEQSLFPPAPRTNQFETGTMTTTTTWTPTSINTNVESGDVPLKVTLVWLDQPGDALARDLDLRVRSPSGLEYHGNQYTDGWTDPVKTAYNHVDNVEQVEVEVPEEGTWTVEVRGFSIPTAAKFALVFAADVGPVKQYKVDLSTTYSTTVSLSPGGSAVIPITALNFGTEIDDIDLASTAPAGLQVTFTPDPLNNLPSKGSEDSLVVILDQGIAAGMYEFDVRGVSQRDPSPTPASDFISIRVEKVDFPVPYALQVTNGTVDELDPSVITFNDGTTDHIFIAYRRTSKVSADQRTGGVNVLVAHTTLDSNGLPNLPFVHTVVSNLNEEPNDLRFLRITAGTYAGRVVLTWTGTDPDETNPDADSWSRIAYLDPPYTAAWTIRTIQKAEGTTTDPCKSARVSFPLFRVASGMGLPGGQLIYIWEAMLMNAGCEALSGVHTYAKISTDGGATWGTITRVFPPPGNNNLFFFPNGYVDQNDVAWVFVYWRTPTGNDRDLTVRLFDNAGWGTFPSSSYTILDTADNAQWPAVLSTSEGAAGNRVYVVFTRDNLQSDLKMVMMYTDKDYTSASMPAAASVSCGTNCLLSPDFDTSGSGSGLLGPYGTSVSNSNYNRRPILNIVRTPSDSIVWLPHIENANPYKAPNLYTYYSGDGFATKKTTILTADAFAKGHQMTDVDTIGGTSRLYEVFHASKGTVKKVNYEVYLLIYFDNWWTAADTHGPLALNLAGTPNPVNKTQTFRLTANINDITTGNSTIASAEYSIDSPTGPWTNMTAWDVFDSPAEAAYADIDVGALGWNELDCHRIYIRGWDVAGNVGSAESYLQCVKGTANEPPFPPLLQSAVLSGAFADVTLTWGKAGDEGLPSGTIAYVIFRDTNLDDNFVNVSWLPATGAATYTWTDVGMGDGEPNIYRYYIVSVDDRSAQTPSLSRAAKYTRPLSGMGWHMVSVPVVQLDPALTTTLQTVSWTRARTYLASDTTDPWKAAIKSKTYWEFTAVDETMSIWILTNVASDTYTVAGIIPSGVTITFHPGWNFIGFPSLRSTAYTVANLKAAVPAVASVETYAAVAPYYLQRMADGDPLLPGFGYWIWSTGTAVWNVP